MTGTSRLKARSTDRELLMYLHPIAGGGRHSSVYLVVFVNSGDSLSISTKITHGLRLEMFTAKVFIFELKPKREVSNEISCFWSTKFP